ncbi:MAG: flagellar hook-length control protein FliK [Aquabacterium sp.]
MPTAQASHGAAAHPSSIPNAATLAEAQLAQPPGGSGFAPALGQQVRLWLQDGIQQAQLQLNPAELGPIQVHIELQGKAASVEFHAAMATTREALQAALPQLAGALHEAGYTLAGGGVFDGAGRDRGTDVGDGRDQRSGSAAAARAARLSQDDGDVSNHIDLTPRRARGLVDLYA